MPFFKSMYAKRVSRFLPVSEFVSDLILTEKHLFKNFKPFIKFITFLTLCQSFCTVYLYFVMCLYEGKLKHINLANPTF